MILCRRVFINTNYFPPYLMDVYNLIEYRFFSWIFVLTMFFSMRYVMTWTLLHFPASFWLNRASKTFWTVVGYFHPMLRIQTLVLSIAVKAQFRRDVVCLLVYFWHAVMFTLLCKDANRTTSGWEINSDFKYIICDERVIWDINF